MGHWSDDLVDELADQLGNSVDRQTITDVLGAVGRNLETLSGRSFVGVHTATAGLQPNGLPLVDVPDAHVGSLNSASDVWEIPDPVNPAMAPVLQLQPLKALRSAATVADALWVAGQLVAEASRTGRLTSDYILHWIGNNVPSEERHELFRQVMDPDQRFYVPVLGAATDGWWFQIARRLLWVTRDTRDEGRMLESLLGDPLADRNVPPFVATEPVLTMARLTHQPVDWAMTARIWTGDVHIWTDRKWATLARAVHGHGVPTIVIDPASTAAEIACQVILKAYWHGYITGDEPTLAKAVETAYASSVERIRRGTHSSTTSAAAALLEQLIFPGFDHALGAEATRRYVRRKASIVVMEHRKRESPDRYPWTRVGVSERRYYKLLPLFTSKANGRYAYDHDDVVARMRAHVAAVEQQREVRSAALSILQSRGFTDAAARKWLQRHEPVEVLRAVPRGTKGVRPMQSP